MTTGEQANDIFEMYCQIIYGMPSNECSNTDEAKQASVYHVTCIIDSNPMAVDSCSESPCLVSMTPYWQIVLDLICSK